MTFRIGAVSYLNTKPLIHHLDQALPHSQLSLDLPSRLAKQLHAGELDVALIPSIELFRSPLDDLMIVSDACIACRGPVWSVQLLFRKQPSEVRTLALDEGSRTSAALAQILLLDRCGIRPQLEPLPIGRPAETAQTDAILVIGDRALRGWGSEFCEVWDLGQQWYETTGLPFVFAMWVARAGALRHGTQGSGQYDESLNAGAISYKDASLNAGAISYGVTSYETLAAGLEAARDAGLAAARQIAAEQAPRYGLTEQACIDYFEKFLYFKLGPRQQQGLELFYQRAVAVGLAPAGREHLLLTQSPS